MNLINQLSFKYLLKKKKKKKKKQYMLATYNSNTWTTNTPHLMIETIIAFTKNHVRSIIKTNIKPMVSESTINHYKHEYNKQNIMLRLDLYSSFKESKRCKNVQAVVKKCPSGSAKTSKRCIFDHGNHISRLYPYINIYIYMPSQYLTL